MLIEYFYKVEGDKRTAQPEALLPPADAMW
jgi:hypothetical protein